MPLKIVIALFSSKPSAMKFCVSFSNSDKLCSYTFTMKTALFCCLDLGTKYVVRTYQIVTHDSLVMLLIARMAYIRSEISMRR